MKFYKLGKKSLIMSVMLGSIVLTGCTTQANKEENLDNYVTIELEKRKAEINAKYKYKINFLKSECDKDFSNKKEEIDENTKKVIQDIQNDYNEKKDEKIKKGDVRGGDNVIYQQYHVASPWR